MNKDLQKETLITGASRGIGRALTEHYLQAGHRVIGLSRTAPDLKHASFTHFNADLSDLGVLKECLAKVALQFERIDHLINNAGIASMNHALLTPLEKVRTIFDVNFHSTYLLCQETARLMKNGGYGRIVNFSTVAVPLNMPGA